MRFSFPALGRNFFRRFGHSLACVLAPIFLLVVFSSAACAQNFADSSKWEIGGHFAFLRLPSQCAGAAGCETTNNGLGANLTYNFSAWIAFDTEMNFFGNNGNAPTATTGGNVTEGLFGFRIGPSTRRWGMYSEVRPGFVNFSRVLSSPSAAAPLLLSSASAGAFAAPAQAANPLNLPGAPQFSARLRYQADASSNPMAVLGFTSATYFALNYGEAIEYRPTKHAALRFDIGDTIVTYPGATLGAPFRQHNFQISQAIVIRF